jgi:hypothetical protein
MTEFCKGNDLVERMYWLSQVHNDQDISWPAFNFAFAISGRFDKAAKGFAVLDPHAMAPRLRVAQLVRAGHLGQGADHLRYRGVLHESTAAALQRASVVRHG